MATRSSVRIKNARRQGPVLVQAPPNVFVALDFETADYQRDSACSVAIVRVEGRKIVGRQKHLIRPPRKMFVFSYIHGITWQDVAGEPAFDAVWLKVKNLLDGAAFIAAHNASFDAGVLRACCAQAGLQPPPQPFVCTVKLARKVWSLKPAKLPDVCRHLGVKLNHHDALSDAEACARIVLAALEAGASVL